MPGPSPTPSPEPGTGTDQEEEAALQQPVVPPRLTDIIGHWAEDAIRAMEGQGILDAAGANAFVPDREAGRGEVIASLWRLAGSPEPARKSPFADASDRFAAWAADQALVLVEERLEADRPLTRQELAVLLYRYARWTGMDAAKETALTYPDAKDIPDWAQEAAAFCQIYGIIKGRPGGCFAPGALATRAEAAVMLQRLLEILPQ